MVKNAVERLEFLCNTFPEKFEAFGEEIVSFKNGNAWSKKEELGHLIDSAANNHQRFIRAQYQPEANIMYQQDEWVKYNVYQTLPSNEIVQLWRLYNLHLTNVIKAIPESYFLNACNTGEETHTLEFLIVDYVAHMEHHLNHILGTKE